MSGVEKTVRKAGKQIDDNIIQKFGAVKVGKRVVENMQDPKGAIKRFSEDIGLTQEIPKPKDEPIIPIPDENAAALAARKRRASRASTGRDSTILTEGLGG